MDERVRFPPIDLAQIASTPPREFPEPPAPSHHARHACEKANLERYVQEAAVRFNKPVRMMVVDETSVLLGPMLLELLHGCEAGVLVVDLAAAARDFQGTLEGCAGWCAAETFSEGQLSLSARAGKIFAQALAAGAAQGMGAGSALAEALLKDGARQNGLLLEAHRRGILCVILYRMGSTFFEFHPEFLAADAAACSHRDLLCLTGVLSRADSIGVLECAHPERFSIPLLHACAVARNLGATPFGWQWIRVHPEHGELARLLGDGIEVLHVEAHAERFVPLMLDYIGEKP